MITLDQLAAPPHMIKTPKGRMACSSLRPGDFVKVPDSGDSVGSTLCILINSAKLKRVAAFWVDTRERSPWTYETLTGGGYAQYPAFEFIGHGKRRAWWRYLPRWLKLHVCEFGRPT